MKIFRNILIIIVITIIMFLAFQKSKINQHDLYKTDKHITITFKPNDIVYIISEKLCFDCNIIERLQFHKFIVITVIDNYTKLESLNNSNSSKIFSNFHHTDDQFLVINKNQFYIDTNYPHWIENKYIYSKESIKNIIKKEEEEEK